MILYEYKVRDNFERVRQLAERIRIKFEQGANPEELLQDASILRHAYEDLVKILPNGVDGGNALRHLFFMEQHLNKGKPESCKNDIEDICAHDLRLLEAAFRAWCGSQVHYDAELSREVVDLLEDNRLDSAVLKAFVILKGRLVSCFGVSDNLDGRQLVNEVFGSKKQLAASLSESERESMRNLLDGLYGIFRNLYSHNNAKPEWHEAEAVLSMVNFALKRIERYRSSMEKP